MSLRARLLLLVILAVLPAVGIEIYGEIELRATREQEISREASRLLRLVAAEQARINEGTRQMLVAFSSSLAVRNGDWAACNDTARFIKAQVPEYSNIGVMGADGHLVCSALSPLPDMARREPMLPLSEMTADGDLLIGTYHHGQVTGRRIITYVLPLPDESGKGIAAARASVDLEWLAQHFADRFTSPNLTLLMADRAGTVLLRLPDNEAWAGKFVGGEFVPILQAKEEGVATMSGIDGEEQIIAYSPLTTSPKGFYVAVGLSKAPYFASIDAGSRQKVGLISLSFALALAAAWFAGSAFIRRPIESLLVTTRQWQAGDYRARTRLAERTSEIGKLGHAFDEMAEAVERREGMRREAEAALARLNAGLEQRVRDEVAEREKAQAALLQTQKIEAIGQLTSGVAHDFNNLLSAVLGNLDLLRGQISDPRGARLLENASRAATRGAKLTEQLLAFSRHRHLEPESFDLNELIRGMSNLLGHTLGPTISVSRSLAPDLWPVHADTSQIEVALLNLVINARDAMPLGGMLLIETTNVPSGHKRMPSDLDGDYVMVAVSDTGTGMADSIKERAFEPFFTTKEVGKGTGLGLSMVYGVARQSGGTAIIDSAAGNGTTVALFLPRASAAPDQRAQEQMIQGPPARRHQGRVLVVDDDNDVREVTAAALIESGLDVTAVDSGQAALALLEHGATFDLMVVDFAMPGLTGVDVIARARERRPRFPAILVTGYAQPGFADALPADVPLVRKPFRVSELVRRVNAALADLAAEPRSNILPLAPPHNRT